MVFDEILDLPAEVFFVFVFMKKYETKSTRDGTRIDSSARIAFAYVLYPCYLYSSPAGASEGETDHNN